MQTNASTNFNVVYLTRYRAALSENNYSTTVLWTE